MTQPSMWNPDYRMFHAVVFDLDDTLFAEREFVFSGFTAVDSLLREEYGVSGFEAVAKKHFADGGRGRTFDHALTQLGIHVAPELIEKLVRCYRRHTPNIRLFDDAQYALELFSRKVKLGIISDGYLETQRSKVEALGLRKWFDVIVLTDELGREYWKPHEAPYREMEERLGSVGRDCVYVGDNPVKDFVTARKRGWTTIRVCRPGAEHWRVRRSPEEEADACISDLYELESVLCRMGELCSTHLHG